MKPLLADGDWFQVIAAILFFLITGLAQWVQKRGRAKRGLPPEPAPDVFAGPLAEPARGMPPVIERARTDTVDQPDWQEQIRRMLEGEPTPPTPSRAPAPATPSGPTSALPPPLPVVGPARPSPHWTETDESFSWEDQPASVPRPPASWEEAQATYARASKILETTEARLKAVSRLPAAASALQRAGHVHEAVADRMRGVIARTEAHVPASTRLPHRVRTASAEAVIALLRHPETARQVMIASVVLQPPKSLE